MQGRRSWTDFPQRRGNVLHESELERSARQLFERDHTHTAWEATDIDTRIRYRDLARLERGR